MHGVESSQSQTESFLAITCISCPTAQVTITSLAAVKLSKSSHAPLSERTLNMLNVFCLCMHMTSMPPRHTGFRVHDQTILDMLSALRLCMHMISTEAFSSRKRPTCRDQTLHATIKPYMPQPNPTCQACSRADTPSMQPKRAGSCCTGSCRTCVLIEAHCCCMTGGSTWQRQLLTIHQEQLSPTAPSGL